MAKPYTLITTDELENLAWDYILECDNFKKEHPTASGKVVTIPDRKIPTVDYFLRIWIPRQGKPTISRTTYYNWLNGYDDMKLDTIKRIEGIFKALAVDILANDNKGASGIFYAKNKLGMTDKTTLEHEGEFKPIQIIANFGTPLNFNNDDNIQLSGIREIH